MNLTTLIKQYFSLSNEGITIDVFDENNFDDDFDWENEDDMFAEFEDEYDIEDEDYNIEDFDDTF